MHKIRNWRVIGNLVACLALQPFDRLRVTSRTVPSTQKISLMNKNKIKGAKKFD